MSGGHFDYSIKVKRINIWSLENQIKELQTQNQLLQQRIETMRHQMNEESKYTISELKEMLKEFYQYHPDQHCDEWYAPINTMETDGAACFLNWVETGEYGNTEWEDD